MQIVSNGDDLHEMSNLVFCENTEKYQFYICRICPEGGKLLR